MILVSSMAAACLVAPALRAQSADYIITTVAGDTTVVGDTPAGYGFNGDGGSATAAGVQFWNPLGLALDSAHNLYIADQLNNRVRQVNSSGTLSTLAGDGTHQYTGNDGPATSAGLFHPCGLATDSKGNVYIGDWTNQAVRVVSGGTITLFAGNNISGYAGDGRLAIYAQLYNPCGVAVDPGGKYVYIADSGNQRIRRVDVTTGNIETAAGNGKAAFAGDGGLLLQASFNLPLGMDMDAAGSLYVADSFNHVIRKLANGIVTTVAGIGGSPGFSGDRGPATAAQLNRPTDVKVDSAGNLFIADYYNGRVRKVSPNGIITTIAGNGHYGYSSTDEGGPATTAKLNYPEGLALGPGGLIYVADSQNNMVRLLTPPQNPGAAPSIYPGGAITASDLGAFASAAPGSWVEIYGTNLASSTASWTLPGNVVVPMPASLAGTSVTIGGQDAYPGYVSPGQVNVQLPLTIAPGTQQITVTTASGTSGPSAITVGASQAGLWAPSMLTVNGKRYVGAILADGKFALPAGSVSGISSRPARPGEIVTLFGVGFGPVIPGISAGRMALVANSLDPNTQLQMSIGGIPATVTSAGLAIGSVGVYQFTVVVPSVPANAAAPFTFTLFGASGPQTLYIAVGN